VQLGLLEIRVIGAVEVTRVLKINMIIRALRVSWIVEVTRAVRIHSVIRALRVSRVEVTRHSVK
jgi:hypothetical protein